jgi:hypothetical protein
MMSIILRLNTATLILAVDVITPPSLRKKGYIIRKEKDGWLLRDPGRDNAVKLTDSGKIKTITRNWIHVAILRWRSMQAGNLVALKFHSEPVKKHQAPSDQDQLVKKLEAELYAISDGFQDSDEQDEPINEDATNQDPANDPPENKVGLNPSDQN